MTTGGMNFFFFLSLLTSGQFSQVLAAYDPLAPETCEPIRVALCMDAPYNLTRMPNRLGHSHQDAVSQAIEEFHPLMKIKCSNNIKFFLCSIFTPLCSENVNKPIEACRSVCEEVKAYCLPTLHEFGFSWPEMLNCSKFPKDETHDLCMKPDQHDRNGAGVGSSSPTGTHFGNLGPDFVGNGDGFHHPANQPGASGVDAAGGDRSRIPGFSQNQSPEPGGLDSAIDGSKNTKSTESKLLPPAECAKKPFVELDFLPDDKLKTCASSCGQDIRFFKTEKDFMEIWMKIWAGLCCGVNAFSILTFFLDRTRFRYPEKPVVFLSSCYCLYSIGYIVRIFLGPNRVACTAHPQTRCGYLVQGGLDNAECVILFLWLYYFCMASSLWWVVLTFTWYLAAYKNWSTEAIAQKASGFCMIAMGLPALQMIVVLFMRKIDGDELSGLCFVGNGDAKALIGFVLAPFSFYALLGSLFILAGFVGMFRVRNYMQKTPPETAPALGPPLNTGLLTNSGGPNMSFGANSNPHTAGAGQMVSTGHQIDKLEKNMRRIGVFALLYLAAACCLIGCYVYEVVYLQKWEHFTATVSNESKNCDFNFNSFKNRGGMSVPHPRVEIYMLKVFMSLLLGITTGCWMLSPTKTVQIWKRFLTGSKFTKTALKPQPQTGSGAGSGGQIVGYFQHTNSSQIHANHSAGVPLMTPYNSALIQSQSSAHHAGGTLPPPLNPDIYRSGGTTLGGGSTNMYNTGAVGSYILDKGHLVSSHHGSSASHRFCYNPPQRLSSQNL